MEPKNRRVIIIDGDEETATFERRLVLPGIGGKPGAERLVETRKVSSSVLVPNRGEMFLLPNHCRFAYSNEGYTVFVIEEPPSIHTVTWRTSGSVYSVMRARLLSSGAHHQWGISALEFRKKIEEQIEFRLAFPYMIRIYLFIGSAYSQVTLWYRNKPLLSSSDDLLIPNLPNRDQYGKMCLSEASKATRGKSFAEMVDFIESEFWSSPWNMDLPTFFFTAAERMPEVASPWEWERMSAIDPLFVLDLPWQSAEKTVESAVAGLVNLNQGECGSFEYFLRRIREADEWGSDPKVVSERFKVSPASEIVLQDGTLIKVGDELRFENSVGGHEAGKTGTVEWFSRADQNSGRYIKISGIEEPIGLIVRNQLASYVKIVKSETKEKVVLGDTEVTPGIFCKIVDPSNWPGRTGFYVVRRVKRGSRGAALVQFEGEAFFTAIGEFGALYPGIELLPAEEIDADGYLVKNEYKLACGAVITCGDKIYVLSSGTLNEHVVKKFLPLKRGETGHAFLSESGVRLVFENAEGRLEPSIVIFPKEPITEVVVGGIKFETGEWVLYDSRPYKISAFSPQIKDRIFVKISNSWIVFSEKDKIRSNFKKAPKISADAKLLEYDDEQFKSGMCLFDKHSRLVKIIRSFEFRGEGFANVLIRWEDDTTALIVENYKFVANRFVAAEMIYEYCGTVFGFRTRLRLKEKIGNYSAGSRFVVYFVALPKNDKELPVVVTTRGVGFELSPKNVELFEICRSGNWIPFCPRSIDKDESGAGKKDLFVGAKVVYIGGDEDSRITDYFEDEKLAKIVPAHITSRDNYYSGRWVCTFDRPLPIRGGCAFPIWEKYLVIADSIKQTGFTTIFDRRKLLSNIAHLCVDVGKPVGVDRNGKEIKIGSRVKVLDSSNIASDVPSRDGRDLVSSGHEFIVVHSGNNGRNWMYLHAGRDIGTECSRTVVGRENVPSPIREQKEWFRSIIFVEARNCEVIG